MSSSSQSPASYPDRLGMSTVNGFYGPGSWAGWFLCTLASWNAIDDGNERVHDTILHVLYTNWAAVDLFRQLSAWNNRGTDGMVEELGGSIAAAFTVTYWGLLTSICQHTFCIMLLESKHGREHNRKGRYFFISRKVAILLLGSAIPSISLVHFQRTLPKMGDPNNGIADYVPALQMGNIGPNIHWAILMGACALGLWTMIYLVFHFLHFIIGPCIIKIDNEVQETELVAQTQVLFAVMAGFSLAASCFIFFFLVKAFTFFTGPFIQIFSTFMIIMFSLVFQSTCLGFASTGCYKIVEICLSIFLSLGILQFVVYFMFLMTLPLSLCYSAFIHNSGYFFNPYAPQKISEWDQAFGLVGLAMLIPDAARAVMSLCQRPRRRRAGDEEELGELKDD